LSPYLNIAETADLARISPKRLRNLMANGTLREGIHYTRPRGLAPRFKRDALLAWLEGTEATDAAIPMASSRQAKRFAMSGMGRV
jgi:hypothetical protein